MTLAQEILVSCAAFAGALFEPLRDCRCDYWSATWFLRWRYSERGLPYRGGGSKDHERALAEAVRSGWLIRRRAARKTVGATATHAGLLEAWRLLGIPSDNALVVTREVHENGPGGRWVPEWTFTGGKTDPEELRLVQAFHSPALVAGWVESNCTVPGHVGYRVTAAGVEALAAAARLNGSQGHPDDPEPDPDALAHYLREFGESIRWLNSQTGVSVDARGEIGALPLPMSAFAPGDAAYTGP